MKFIKSSIKELKNNRWWVLTFLLVLALSQFLIQYRPLIIPTKYLVIALIAIVILFSTVRLKEKTNLARNTFLIIMILGTVNSLILPIRQGLDENTHFFYSVQIADGHFFTHDFNQMDYLSMSPNFLAVTQLPSKPERGDEVNTNLYTNEFLKIKNQKTDYTKEGVATGVANPVYYPSALGIAIGRLISPYFFVSYYLGRIFNLLMFGLLAFFAVKISKKYQLQLFVISLLPYTLWNSAGYNYDTLFYGAVLLVLAQLTNFIGEEKTVTTQRMFGYLFSCFIMVFCKAPMALLALIPFFLPKEAFATEKVKKQSALISILGLILGLAWIERSQIFNIIRTITKGGLTASATSATDNSNRINYFLNHPLDTFTMGIRSVFDVLSNIKDSIAQPQPFLYKVFDTGSLELFNILLIGFVLLLVSYRLEIKFPQKLKTVTSLIFIVVTIGIIYAISGDSRVFRVGDLNVSGVQGRYHYYILAFVPLFIAQPVQRMFGQNEMIKSEDYQNRIEQFVVGAVLLMTFINTCIGLFGYL
ncbi:DUF2142 domain-containing protein [Lactococcus lactis]|uniref:DUF2142 domain-containing protein n=1 Tax=Lactococcus lactis TaxID=1358 RepID=UPI0027389901|nr:DUF2142 domain-containing protein [Lactococcus lactis]